MAAGPYPTSGIVFVVYGPDGGLLDQWIAAPGSPVDEIQRAADMQADLVRAAGGGRLEIWDGDTGSVLVAVEVQGLE